MYNLNIPIEAKRYYIENLIEVNNKIEDYKKTLEDLITTKENLEKAKNDLNKIEIDRWKPIYLISKFSIFFI